MDYQSHLHKFGPLLSEAYVTMIVGRWLHHHRNIMNEEIKQGKFKTLDMLHHFTSGLKSLYSQMAYDGIELVRVNCGGAGYSAWSYLPQLYYNYSPVPVYEGDNTVMAQQTLGYIQKKVKKIQQKIPAYGVFEYLNHLEALLKEKNSANTVEQFLDIKFLEKALSIRAAYWVSDVLKKLSQKGMKKKTAMNDLYAQDLLAMSRNHHLYLSFLIYIQDVEK